MISQSAITAFAWEHMPVTTMLEAMQHQHHFEAIHLAARNLLYCVYLCPSMSQLLKDSSSSSKESSHTGGVRKP